MKIRWLKSLSFDKELYKKVNIVMSQLAPMPLGKIRGSNFYTIRINSGKRLLAAEIKGQIVILDILKAREEWEQEPEYMKQIRGWKKLLSKDEDIEVTIGFTDEPQVTPEVLFADNVVIPRTLIDAFQKALQKLSQPSSSDKFFQSTPSLSSIQCGSSRLLYTMKGTDYVILDIIHPTDKEYPKKILGWKERIKTDKYSLGEGPTYDPPQESLGDDDVEDTGLLFS